MNIVNILENVRVQISNSQPVQFQAEELNIMSDENQIRALKIRCPMPENFEKSESVDDCLARIKAGDSIYRVLEYCILTNRALQSISKYVKRLG